jgi:hypothetical protein
MQFNQTGISGMPRQFELSQPTFNALVIDPNKQNLFREFIIFLEIEIVRTLDEKPYERAFISRLSLQLTCVTKLLERDLDVQLQEILSWSDEGYSRVVAAVNRYSNFGASIEAAEGLDAAVQCARTLSGLSTPPLPENPSRFFQLPQPLLNNVRSPVITPGDNGSPTP